MKRANRFLGAAAAASLLLGAAACGDDDDDAASDDVTTTTESDDVQSIEVTLTPDGIEGLPSELEAGLVEVTLVNELGDYGSLDFSRVEPGTTEEEFVEGLAPLFEGGAFPDFFESNAGVSAMDGETVTSMVILPEGEYIAWAEPPGDDAEGEGGEEETQTETETETATETEAVTETETETDDVEVDETTTTTTAAGGDQDGTTTTVAGDEEQGAAGEATLTAAATEEAPEDGVGGAVEDEPLAEEPGQQDADGPTEEGGEAGAPEVLTASLTVTPGDADAELPEADGEIVATDYEFDVQIDGAGETFNFRNDGPQQFHHAVLMDFGTNDPSEVEEAFPALLESEGDPSSMPDTGLDMEQVNFDFGGSGVFGPDRAAGTFQADITEGNTYVVVCFIQDRSGGPPHAIAYDMWEVFQAGGGDTTTTTTEG